MKLKDKNSKSGLCCKIFHSFIGIVFNLIFIIALFGFLIEENKREVTNLNTYHINNKRVEERNNKNPLQNYIYSAQEISLNAISKTLATGIFHIQQSINIPKVDFRNQNYPLFKCSRYSLYLLGVPLNFLVSIGNQLYSINPVSIIILKCNAIIFQTGNLLIIVLLCLVLSSLICFLVIKHFYNSIQRDVELFRKLIKSDTWKNNSIVESVNYKEFAFLSDLAIAMVSERKQVEKSLKDSEIHYRYLFEQNPIPIVIFELNSLKIVAVNEAFTVQYNYKKEEALAILFTDLFPDDEKERVCEMVKKMTRLSYSGEWHHLKKDGTRIIVDFYSHGFSYEGENARVAVITDITNRRLIENTLKRNEELYRTIFNNTGTATILIDENNIISLANTEFENLTQYTKSEIEGIKELKDFLKPEQFNSIHNVFNNDRIIQLKYFECVVTSKDGEDHTVLLNVDIIPDSNRRIASLLDITERKMIEEKLKFNNAILSTQLNASKDGILVVDENSDIISYNQQFKNMWEISSETNNLKSISQLFQLITTHLSAPEEFIKNFNFLKEHLNETIKEEILLKDCRTIEIYSAPMLGDEQKYYGRVWYFSDISERKLAEREILNERTLLRTLIDNLPVGVFVKDKDYNKIIVNQLHINEVKGHLEYLGLNSNVEILNKNDFDVFPKSLAKKFLREDRKVIENGAIILNRIGHGFNSKGEKLWLLVSKIPLRDKENEIIGMIGVATDFTERKSIEEKFKQNEHLLKQILESNPNLIFIYTVPELEVNFISRNIWPLLGYPDNQSDEMSFKKILQYIQPDDQQRIIKHFERFKEANDKDILEIEYRILMANGQWKWIRQREVVFNRSNEGESFKILGTAIDITDQKETEQKILNATIEAEERERSYFAREVHDGLGPLLSSIKLYFQWLNKPNLNTPKSQILANIDATIQEAISSTREISHKLSPHILMNFGLSFAVNSFIEKLKETTPVQITFESNIDHRLEKEVEITLYRAVIELINNTLKYANASDVRINIFKNQNQIILNYSDNGVGFDYNETLKSGKGLGLFNLQNRISVLGGTFSIKSLPDKGVGISAQLPLD